MQVQKAGNHILSFALAKAFIGRFQNSHPVPSRVSRTHHQLATGGGRTSVDVVGVIPVTTAQW